MREDSLHDGSASMCGVVFGIMGAAQPLRCGWYWFYGVDKRCATRISRPVWVDGPEVSSHVTAQWAMIGDDCRDLDEMDGTWRWLGEGKTYR